MLHGERLAGRWVIVRTSGRGGGLEQDGEDQWLLMHKRGRDLDEAWDIDAFPTSVVSGRTNDEVEAGAGHLGLQQAGSGGAHRPLGRGGCSPIPDFIPPALATAVDAPFSDPDWLFEMKLDGYRVEAVVRRQGAAVDPQPRRRGALLPGARCHPPTWIAAREAIVDGEVVALDEQGNPDFSLLQDRTLQGHEGPGKRRARATSASGDGEEAAAPPPPAGPAPRWCSTRSIWRHPRRAVL